MAAFADPAVVVDGDGTVRDWNDAVPSRTGRATADLRGAALGSLFATPSVDRVTAALDRAAATGRATVEASLVTTDGARLPHEVTASALPDGGALVVARPVTDHQRALERVRDGFFSLDEDWRLTYVNESATPVLADAMSVETDDPTDLVGRHLWDAIPEAVGTSFYDRYHEARRTGEPVSFEADYDPLDIRLGVSVFPSETGLSIYFRDVTERRAKEQSLERQASTLREMHDVIADQTLAFEEQVAALLGIGRSVLDAEFGTLSRVEGDRWIAEVVDAAADTIEAGDVYPLSATNCERTAATEETLVLGDVARDAPDLTERDGFVEWGIACYLGAPIWVDGAVYGTFCFYDSTPRDGFDDWEVTLVDLMARWVSAAIERERRTERLERQNQRLDDFASFVSHDLRNPLSVLQGRLDLAEETGDPEEFAACRAAVDRMDALIDDLLTLARAGDIGEREAVDLAAATDRAWGRVDAPAATLRVETDRTLQAAPGPLAQLLENLLSNAVEHGSTGSQNAKRSGDVAERSSAGSRSPTDSDDAVEHGSTADDPVTITVGDLPDGFYVADDGPGIPQDERDRVFERGHTTDREGTGFGLAIVAEVAAAHDWSVEAVDAASGGARVEITGV